MFVPAICSVYYGENDLWPIIYSALITVGIGLPLRFYFKGEEELNIKDGIFIAVFGWFLVSALSTGIAMIIFTQALLYEPPPDNPAAEKLFHQSGYLLTASDLMLIGFELIVIFLFIMFAYLTVGNVEYAVAVVLPGGELAPAFWLWVVVVGLLIPGFIELVYVAPKFLYHRGYESSRTADMVISIAVLAGGFMLRYVVVVAGQITGPVGL